MVEGIKKLGLVVERTRLDAGDYVINDVLVERKEINDLFNSLHKGRLWEQLYKMKLSGMQSVLVVVGMIPRHGDVYGLQYFLQKLKTIKLWAFFSYGVMTMVVPTNDDFFRLIQDIWNWSSKGPSLKPVVKKSRKIVDIKSDIITCVPGFGRKTADELARKYKLIELAGMTVRKLSNIKINRRKIGKKALKFREVFNS